MSDISLTASMRSNLLSLQNTQSLMDQTQERLSTGKKVNSAIDNPSSYYTAQSLTNRASDLSGLLDSMGQAVQTIQAANEGIEAITNFANQAKAVANSAFDTSDAASVENYMAQFNSIMDQIDSLAKDSGYKGINLLNDDDLKVTFNEDRTSSLTIEGEKADSASLGMHKVQDGDWVVAGTEIKSAAEYDSTSTTKITTGTYIVNGDKLYQAKTDIGDGAAAVGAFNEANFDLISDDAEVVAAAQTAEGVTIPGAIDKSKIEATVKEVEGAINKLRDMASVFGNNHSIVQNREEFTENLINVLTEGADKLTLADMNEESANMLALQTRQQLAINSLSLASQAAQSVLKLF